MNPYKNIDKVVINVGIGRLSGQPSFDDKILPELIKEISMICGQKPSVCRVKKSIAGFKVREGAVVGLKATLRGARLKEFLNKFINAVLPRVRDFRGINPKSLDQNGNLTMSLKEHYVFPEISSDYSKVNFGLEITVVPKLQKKEKATELYKELKIPFKK